LEETEVGVIQCWDCLYWDWEEEAWSAFEDESDDDDEGYWEKDDEELA
jgi:hypothetical protein